MRWLGRISLTLATVAVRRIEPVKRTAKPGSRPCGPNAAFFPST